MRPWFSCGFPLADYFRPPSGVGVKAVKVPGGKVLVGRKQRLLFRLAGAAKLRWAERTIDAGLLNEPPRNTRLDVLKIINPSSLSSVNFLS